jgi:hypothetical protein
MRPYCEYNCITFFLLEGMVHIELLVKLRNWGILWYLYLRSIASLMTYRVTSQIMQFGDIVIYVFKK